MRNAKEQRFSKKDCDIFFVKINGENKPAEIKASPEKQSKYVGFEYANRNFEDLCDSLKKLNTSMFRATMAVKTLANSLRKIAKNKVVYLSQHAKKLRTRKKNKKRLQKLSFKKEKQIKKTKEI